MSTREYCGRHSIHYAGDSCPRCNAEERHKELLNATEATAAETVEAMRQSDDRRANPGDYACPHCKYISLKSEASRCPLCRGDVGSDYWNRVRAAEKAAEERRQAEVAARVAEEKRTAPARAAAARAAARAEALKNRRAAISAIVGESFVMALGVGVLSYFIGSLGGCLYRWGQGRPSEVQFRYSLSAWKSTGLMWAVVAMVAVCAIGLLRCLFVKSVDD